MVLPRERGGGRRARGRDAFYVRGAHGEELRVEVGGEAGVADGLGGGFGEAWGRGRGVGASPAGEEEVGEAGKWEEGVVAVEEGGAGEVGGADCAFVEEVLAFATVVGVGDEGGVGGCGFLGGALGVRVDGEVEGLEEFQRFCVVDR